jgi:hypothetical protein
MIAHSKITQIFCSIDDFCQQFLPAWNRHLLASGAQRLKPGRLSVSEVMSLQVLFHLSGIRTFKKFYTDYVCRQLTGLFPDLVSYTRMVELCSQTMIPLAVYLKTQGTGACTGISFIDSTPLRVCHNRRIHSHKVFDGLAARGQCSIGWFYGFKLHLVTSDTGHIISLVPNGPSSCVANFGIPTILPNDAILVHIHPFKKGDILQCPLGRGWVYKNKPGLKDRETLEEADLEQGIILDVGKIIFFTPNESETPILIDRCGY